MITKSTPVIINATIALSCQVITAVVLTLSAAFLTAIMAPCCDIAFLEREGKGRNNESKSHKIGLCKTCVLLSFITTVL